MTAPRTLFDRVWDEHVIQALDGGWALLHIDRHILHEISGSAGLNELAGRGLPVRNPALAIATPDHMVSTAPGRDGATHGPGAGKYIMLKELTAKAGMRLYDLGQPGQGIVHVAGAELGMVLPGTTVVCGDSHTCTNGALGALAFGIGTSEVGHVLATQTLMQRRPKTLRVRIDGQLRPGVTAKDLALAVVARVGASGGTGHAIEYAGSAVEALGVEQRMTLCNLSIEMGAKVGMVAPDAKTFDYLRGRPLAPQGALWEQAMAHWATLRSEPGARFDREVVLDAAQVAPMLTWGTSPEQAVPLSGRVPMLADSGDAQRGEAWRKALEYMGLHEGQALAGLPVDRVFIGSCTNSRISDLREAAALIQGRSVAPNVRAWVVPGSENVKRQAEAEGLHTLFTNAGFDWREAGCSMCVGINGETAAPGERVVSTSNRNFVGRQGPNVRTHLASPATAVESAIAGVVTAGSATTAAITAATTAPT